MSISESCISDSSMNGQYSEIKVFSLAKHLPSQSVVVSFMCSMVKQVMEKHLKGYTTGEVIKGPELM